MTWKYLPELWRNQNHLYTLVNLKEPGLKRSGFFLDVSGSFTIY